MYTALRIVSRVRQRFYNIIRLQINIIAISYCGNSSTIAKSLSGDVMCVCAHLYIVRDYYHYTFR